MHIVISRGSTKRMENWQANKEITCSNKKYQINPELSEKGEKINVFFN